MLLQTAVIFAATLAGLSGFALYTAGRAAVNEERDRSF
jgi:hypothetical protein